MVPQLDNAIARLVENSRPTRNTQPIVINGEEYWPERHFASVMTRDLRTVRLWEQLRTGPPRIRVGSLVLYRKSAVEQWLKANESRLSRPRRRARG